MDKILIEFEKTDTELQKFIVELYGDEISSQFIETKKFNGDVVDVIISIIIPITVPFFVVLYQKSLEKNKNKVQNGKTVRFINGEKEIVFENYDLQELKKELKNNFKELNENK